MDSFPTLSLPVKALLYIGGLSVLWDGYSRSSRRFFWPMTVLALMLRGATITTEAQMQADGTLLRSIAQVPGHFPIGVRVILEDSMGLVVVFALVSVVTALRKTTPREGVKAVVDSLWNFVRTTYIPGVSERIERELQKNERAIEEMFEQGEEAERLFQLPKKGKSDQEIIRFMKRAVEVEDEKWKNGYVSGAVYSGEPGHTAIMNTAFSCYSLSNPLHPDIWPSVRKFEAEIVSMTCSLLNGGRESVCGCMTSGGTESIILAAKAHRDYYRRIRGIDKPEIVAPTTAHAAIDKAASLLGIRCASSG